MENLTPRTFFVILLVVFSLAGCAGPQATAISPSATPAQATITKTIPSTTPIPPRPTNTLLPPTEVRTPTPVAPTPATTPNVKIAMHPGADPNQNELWLEFPIPNGEELNGNALSENLDNGSLQIILPDGTVKSFDKVPPAPKDAASAQYAVWLPEGVGINNLNGSPGAYFLSEYTFENYNSSPSGPQIRIPLEQVMNGFEAGAYQISWSSVGSLSETMILQWDGKAARSISQ